MKEVASIILTTISLLAIFGCGGPKVTHYEESRIISIAWAGDSLVAYCSSIERGFIAGGIRRNPKQSTELMLAEVAPQRGTIDTTYKLRDIPDGLGRMAFFPGGERLFYAAKDGVRLVELADGSRKDFFTHPSIKEYPKELDVGPRELYLAFAVNAEGLPGTENLLDLFMVRIEDGYLAFHTDSLLDSRSFAWVSEDCIAYITPDPWEPEKNRIMQFGVHDCIIKPSDLSEYEVRCNCPKEGISASGRWEAVDEKGKLVIKPVKN